MRYLPFATGSLLCLASTVLAAPLARTPNQVTDGLTKRSIFDRVESYKLDQAAPEFDTPPAYEFDEPQNTKRGFWDMAESYDSDQPEADKRDLPEAPATDASEYRRAWWDMAESYEVDQEDPEN